MRAISENPRDTDWAPDRSFPQGVLIISALQIDCEWK